MRTRSWISLAVGFLLATLAAAQMPPPGGTIPPGYGCTDPDTGAWVPEGGMRSQTTTPDLENGSQTVRADYVCRGGKWALYQRATMWNTNTVVNNPNNKVTTSEGGTRNEMFDPASGFSFMVSEFIGRHTATETGGGLFGASVVKEDRCIQTFDSNDGKNPASTAHRKVERWIKTDNSWGLPLLDAGYESAGYKEDVDDVGYDGAGNLALDFHSTYQRQKTGSDPPMPWGTRQATFFARYSESGQTVMHPMSYMSMYLLGPDDGWGWNTWSQIPQYDYFGNFLGYKTESYGETLMRAKAHEYFICGIDDGWAWIFNGYHMN